MASSVIAAISVLILEDDFEFGTFLAGVCRLHGYSAANVVSPAEAEWQLGQKVYDVLVADLNLRDVDCIDVIATLKAAWPDMVIIAMTIPSNGEQPRARRAGSTSSPPSCCRRGWWRC